MACLLGCARERSEPSEAAAEKQSEPPSHVHRSTNGQVIVTLDALAQSAAGLRTSALAAAQLTPEMKGFGRVLDVAPLATLVAELTTAEAASQASAEELKRLKGLAAQNNASIRALQAAEAAAVRDATQVDAAHLRLLAGWGQAIAQRKDLVSLIQDLGSLTSALVEVDLPSGEEPNAPPTGVRLVTMNRETGPVEGEYLGPAPAVTALQGRGYLFLVAANSARLAPGAAVTAFMTLPGPPDAGVALPDTAVVRFNGTAWVYRKTADDSFERKEVTLNSPLPGGWFLRRELKPGDTVVTVGAQELLSEELKTPDIE